MDDDAVDLPQLPPLPLGNSVWACRPDVLVRVTEAHRHPGTPAWARVAARAAVTSPQVARRTAGQRAGGAVAVIPLTGILTPRGSFLSMLFGGGYGGLQDFRQEFRDAVASPDVGAIVIDVDSPGGLHAMVPETATEVLEARGTKPIIAVANTMAASGAYWIGAMCDEFVVTPSGDVGSIGTYMVHEDWSGFNEQLGVVPTYISAGEYKVELNPDEPLSDDARAYLQQEADGIYADFVAAVAAGRGITVDEVLANYGQGRCLRAEPALAAGMVDRIDTIEAVIGGLLNPGTSGGAAARAGRVTILRPSPRAEAAGGDEPAADADVPANDPTHVPEETPGDAIDDADKDVVEPDVGPDAPSDDDEPDAPAESAEDRADELDVLTA